MLEFCQKKKNELLKTAKMMILLSEGRDKLL